MASVSIPVIAIPCRSYCNSWMRSIVLMFSFEVIFLSLFFFYL
nr:MAG TPA: hypothetical protein [Caudoviricetes sp.]